MQRDHADGGAERKGMYGEIGTAHVLKLLAALRDLCGMSMAAGSHLVDLGSGVNR